MRISYLDKELGWGGLTDRKTNKQTNKQTNKTQQGGTQSFRGTMKSLDVRD
jgi:hypothetical protein